jgi:hypothetical protein
MVQRFKRLGAVIVFGAAVSVSGFHSRAAESPCKGLGQEPCQTQGCSWVKSYKTSKGKDVSAFCRKKPERKATTAAAAPKS